MDTEGLDTFEEWLGVETEVNGAERLPERLVEILKNGWTEEIINDEDVPAEDVTLEKPGMDEMVDLWTSFYSDIMTAVRKKAPLTSEKLKLERWLRARFAVDVDVPAKSVAPKALTKQAKEDMIVQGATEPWQIGYIDLALALARPVAPSDCDGFEHKQGWKSSICDRGRTSSIASSIKNTVCRVCCVVYVIPTLRLLYRCIYILDAMI